MPKNQSPNAVSLDTKIFFIKAYVHLMMIPALYFLLTLAIVGGTAYNYYNLPRTMTIVGQTVSISPEQIENAKEMILKGIAGITIIPFVVLGVLSGLMGFYKNKFWYGFCALFTLGIIFVFSGYCVTTLAVLKLKYVWPAQILSDVMATTPPGMPISSEQAIELFVKVLVLTITVCMFLAVVVQIYCVFVLVNLSFLYKPPKSMDLHAVKVAPRQRRKEEKREETVEEEKGTEGGETGTQTADDEEGKSKESEVRKVDKS